MVFWGLIPEWQCIWTLVAQALRQVAWFVMFTVQQICLHLEVYLHRPGIFRKEGTLNSRILILRTPQNQVPQILKETPTCQQKKGGCAATFEANPDSFPKKPSTSPKHKAPKA